MDNTTNTNKNIFSETLKEGFNKVFGGVKTAALALIVALSIVGCKTVPSVDDITTLSTAVGASTAAVCNLTQMSPTSRVVVAEIVSTVENCVPETNQTITAAWTPIAKEHVQKLVDAGKIDATEGQIILAQFSLICNGADYMLKRYSKANQYKELMSAGVHGFCDGFLKYFKRDDSIIMASPDGYMDADAYEYLMNIRNSK